MSNRQVKLPVVDDPQQPVCCNDKQGGIDYGDIKQANWITDQVETKVGSVYRVATTLDKKSWIGTVKTRCSFGRMNYRIPPAIYAVGNPNQSSPVLVSANYKLSFDYLRRELSGLNLWILVIDTDGINVWCAAGKGTFGTEEIVRMVSETGLSELVDHRTLILPQLAAPGVSAHEVREKSGFKIVYGPVRAPDLPAFLEAGNKAEPGMRRTTFRLGERLVLAPVELVGMNVPLIIILAALFLLNLAADLVKGNPLSAAALLGQTFYDLIPFLGAILIGVVMVPALIPYIPGRALAWKGWILGLIWAALYLLLFYTTPGWLPVAAYLLIIPSITAFLGMNYTGSTTYTSLSGVIKEMSIALPLIIVSTGVGIIAYIATYF